jgi:hypothetical protein
MPLVAIRPDQVGAGDCWPLTKKVQLIGLGKASADTVISDPGSA